MLPQSLYQENDQSRAYEPVTDTDHHASQDSQNFNNHFGQHAVMGTANFKQQQNQMSKGAHHSSSS